MRMRPSPPPEHSPPDIAVDGHDPRVDRHRCDHDRFRDSRSSMTWNALPLALRRCRCGHGPDAVTHPGLGSRYLGAWRVALPISTLIPKDAKRKEKNRPCRRVPSPRREEDRPMEGAKSLLTRPGTDHVATRLACEDIQAPPPHPSWHQAVPSSAPGISSWSSGLWEWIGNDRLPGAVHPRLLLLLPWKVQFFSSFGLPSLLFKA